MITVSELVDLMDGALISTGSQVVEGEVSDFKIKDGKWVLFDLKDEKSRVGCFMTAWNLKTEIENGMKVRAVGEGRLKAWGQFSFNLSALTPVGEGSLKQAFELLRKKLTKEGLFSDERRRPLPSFPQHLALITSRDAAAYSDFIKVLQELQGGLNISFWHVKVQGDEAAGQIVDAMHMANASLPELDAIVLIRGGGSMEDLQAFNEESVVRAVAESRVPTMVGIGHERDVTLAELAADLRASTPSNAAQLLVQSRVHLRLVIDQWMQSLQDKCREALARRDLEVQHMAAALSLRFKQAAEQAKSRLALLDRVLRSLSPETNLKRGYSITRNSRGEIIKHANQVESGDGLMTQVWRGKIAVEVVEK